MQSRQEHRYTSLDSEVSAETNLFCACSTGVGYEWSDITLILALPINPATTVQGTHIQGQLVSPKPHVVTVPGVNLVLMHFARKSPFGKRCFTVSLAIGTCWEGLQWTVNECAPSLHV